MKILYGVQGTGNGHISRARMMAKHFAKSDMDVTYLFSGRKLQDYFDMAVFGDFKCRAGLTFATKNGKLSYAKTLYKNNILRYLYDIYSLDIDNYDLILSDFEPITAWAAKIKAKPILGIGHQYAFHYPIPRDGNNILAAFLMKHFAPAKSVIGFHWDAFGYPILPPIIDPALTKKTYPEEAFGRKKIVVYLPFENQQDVQRMLEGIDVAQFYVYSPELNDGDFGNLHLRKTNHAGFKADLASADGVICNCGFELVSECLHLGLSILTKPLQTQVEQLSNAKALQILALAKTTPYLNRQIVSNWLGNLRTAAAIRYPDVAAEIVAWLASGMDEEVASLSQRLWQSADLSLC